VFCGYQVEEPDVEGVRELADSRNPRIFHLT